MIVTAKRLEQFGEYFFSKVADEIKVAEQHSGRKVINLGIGSPDLPPMQEVLTFAKTLFDDPQNHMYPSYKGEKVLRDAMARYYKKRFGVDLDAETEILPLIGSKEGLVHACLAFLNPGENALVPNPGYPAYAAGPKLAGASTQEYGLSEKTNWLPDLKAIESLDLSRTKLWWLGYPNNPTGALAPRTKLEEWVKFAKKHNLFILYDNPYADIYFGTAKPHSILEIPGAKDVAMEFNSLSKSHNLAGWRVGMALSNVNAIKALLTVKSNVDTGIFPVVQKAAAFALNETSEEWIRARNNIYKERRELVLSICADLGLFASIPEASLYVWAKVPEHVKDVEAFSLNLVQRAQVFITPGTVFGTQGKRYVRISLCQPVAVLHEVKKRLKETKHT